MGDVNYIAQIVEDEKDLDHSGVKGMKWGVRKDGRGKLRRGATKANTALDAGAKAITEGEKKLIFLPKKNRTQAAARTQTRLLGVAMAINKSPEFKGKDLKTDPALKERYKSRVADRAGKIYAEELGVARQDAWREFLDVKTPSDDSVVIRAAKDHVEHSDDSDGFETLLTLKLTLDDNGFVTAVGSELEHSGVKGMKWGVRKDDRKPSGPKPIVAPSKGPSSESSAEKYVRLSAHAKKHGANSLDDDDLRFVTSRGNAIAQVNRLNEKKPGWVTEVAKQVLKQQAQKRLSAASENLSKKYIDEPLGSSKSE